MVFDGDTPFICIDILSTPFVSVAIEGGLSTRIRFGAGCTGLVLRTSGTSSSSSLNVRSTICGGPLLREGVNDPGDGRTEVDAVRGTAGGRDAGVGAPLSSSSSSRDTISAFGGPKESLRSDESLLSSDSKRGRVADWLLRSFASG